MIELIKIFELFFSVAFTIYILNHRNWFLLWIPFLELSGRWLLVIGVLPREYNAICSYTELLMVISIALTQYYKKLDIISVMLIFLGFSAIPSLINSGNHFFFSLFFTICFLCGPWIYLFFKDLLRKANVSQLVDLTVLTWTGLGILNKLVFGYLTGGNVIFQRAGGYFGSNRLGCILFLLLPLVRTKWIAYVTVGLLLTQFSKGIIYTLVVYLILWSWYINRKAFKLVLLAVLFVLASWSQVGDIPLKTKTGSITLRQNMIGRFTKGDEGSLIRSLVMRVMIDERVVLWKLGLERSNAEFFNGIGLGGSSWEIKEHYGQFYSNFHNVYITALSEGGLVFTIILVVLLLYLLWSSYIYNRRAFVGLLTWFFYSFFNGQLYDVSRAPTCADFYYLLFVASLIRHSQVVHQLSNRGRLYSNNDKQSGQTLLRLSNNSIILGTFWGIFLRYTKKLVPIPTIS